MPFVDTSTLQVVQRLPGWRGRSFNSRNMTFAHYSFDEGARIHEHCHSNEEVWTVLEGELEVTIGSDSIRAAAGFVAIVPSYKAHGVLAITDGKAIVTDCPVREDPSNGERGVVRVQFERAFSLPETRLAEGFSIPFTLHNTGKTAVTIKSVNVETGFSPALPPAITTVIPAGDIATRAVIEPGGTHEEVASPTLTGSTEDSPAESSILFVRGVVIYDDAFGSREQTTFCRIYDSAAFEESGGFVLPGVPGYNYGS